MIDDESNWFSNWEEELPSPEELMPLSQTLITADLASAFDIGTVGNSFRGSVTLFHSQNSSLGGQLMVQSSSTPKLQPPPTHPNSSEFDSSSAEFGCGGGSGGAAGSGSDQDPARTMKRPRLVWTPQLHKRFVDAVAHLGIKNAVPKTIMQLMSVDGLTRENVASHLQKYRLYLKRVQVMNNGGGNGLGCGSDDPAIDRLFASSPVPAHFLHQANGNRTNADHFMSYMPVTPLHHQQMAAAVASHHQIQAQFTHHHRQMGHFGSSQIGGQFDNPYLSRQAQFGPARNGLLQTSSVFVEDSEARKVLTLFPTANE